MKQSIKKMLAATASSLLEKLQRINSSRLSATKEPSKGGCLQRLVEIQGLAFRPGPLKA
jgi:hypothetical protein